MAKIYRILGKRGNTTIPYALRVFLGFRPNDLLSFRAESDIFRHYLRWPYPMYKPSQFDSFNHEHTCLASKLTNIELSDICPLAKAGQPFEVARENTCEECKYFCRIHYEVDPEYGDKQVHFWMNEEIVTFF